MNATRRALAACLAALVLTLAGTGCTLSSTYPDMSACHAEKGEVVC